MDAVRAGETLVAGDGRLRRRSTGSLGSISRGIAALGALAAVAAWSAPDAGGKGAAQASPLDTPPVIGAVVATALSTSDLASERVCLEGGGLFVLEAEAEAGNAASAFLTVDDGSAEGAFVAGAIRWAGQPQRSRSEEFTLQAEKACYFLIAQTGIVNRAATARLVRVGDTPDQAPDLAERGSNGVVCDQFELRWELIGRDLLLVIDTDLPDEGELSVSVQRYYFKKGVDEPYVEDYFHSFEPVSRWRKARRISLDPDTFRAALAEAARRLRWLGGFEVERITDDVEVRAVLHLNQDDPRFGGPGNPSLSGTASSRLGDRVLVEAEAAFKLPL